MKLYYNFIIKTNWWVSHNFNCTAIAWRGGTIVAVQLKFCGTHHIFILKFVKSLTTVINISFISAMVSYNIVVGDTATKVIVRLLGLDPQNTFAKREIIVLLATIFISIPLCLYKDIAKLAKISFLSLICNVFILFSIFMRMGTMSTRV